MLYWLSNHEFALLQINCLTFLLFVHFSLNINDWMTDVQNMTLRDYFLHENILIIYGNMYVYLHAHLWEIWEMLQVLD